MIIYNFFSDNNLQKINDSRKIQYTSAGLSHTIGRSLTIVSPNFQPKTL